MSLDRVRGSTLSDVVIERSKLLMGVVSVAAALAVVASGGGWWAFRPGRLGVTLLAGPWEASLLGAC